MHIGRILRLNSVNEGASRRESGSVFQCASRRESGSVFQCASRRESGSVFQCAEPVVLLYISINNDTQL